MVDRYVSKMRGVGRGELLAIRGVYPANVRYSHNYHRGGLKRGRGVPDNDVVLTNVAAGLLLVARQLGLDYSQWVSRAGIPKGAIEVAGAKLRYRQVVDFIEAAVVQYPDISLGIEVGTRSKAPNGVLGFAMNSSKSVHEAIVFGQSAHRAAGTLLDFDVCLQSGMAQLVVSERRPETIARVFLYEEFLSSAYLQLQAMVGDVAMPVGIDWPFPRPSYHRLYTRLFRCPQTFCAQRCVMYFDASLLDLPIKGYNETNLRMAQSACRELSAAVGGGDSGLANDVRQVVRERLPQRIGVAAIASSLSLSERTLRRNLAAQGLSCQQIKESEWGLYAEQQLKSSTVAEVAELMGFGDARDFRRAFKRWVGRPPRQPAD